MSAVTENWWRGKGSSQMPRYKEVVGSETLFRVCGGATNSLYGSYYSLVKPMSVSDAEFSMNIVKHGNRCYYVATFNVNEGTPLWVGLVDQSYENRKEDDGQDVFIWGNSKAEQVYIPKWKALVSLMLKQDVEPLRQDCWVVIPANRGRAGHT